MTLKKKVGLDGRRFGRGSLTTESERQTILDFIDNNKNIRLSVLCKYLDISSRTIQRWRKNGLTDKRKGASKNVPKNAKLIFWGNNDITARSTFITHKKIQIGVNTVISWDCLFMDTDFHNVLHHSL